MRRSLSFFLVLATLPVAAMDAAPLCETTVLPDTGRVIGRRDQFVHDFAFDNPESFVRYFPLIFEDYGDYTYSTPRALFEDVPVTEGSCGKTYIGSTDADFAYFATRLVDVCDDILGFWGYQGPNFTGHGGGEGFYESDVLDEPQSILSRLRITEISMRMDGFIWAEGVATYSVEYLFYAIPEPASRAIATSGFLVLASVRRRSATR